ncbi:MAG: reverse transcriptase domain-containing protein [Stellaceae bacterium]
MAFGLRQQLSRVAFGLRPQQRTGVVFREQVEGGAIHRLLGIDVAAPCQAPSAPQPLPRPRNLPPSAPQPIASRKGARPPYLGCYQETTARRRYRLAGAAIPCLQSTAQWWARLNDASYTEIRTVPADLSDYFSSIPHGPLMRCVSRRVADGTLLSVIKRWLTAPVVERDQRATRCTTEAKDRHRGTPQGSPISPLLANLYFRRFLLAWERFGHRRRLDAHVVNYADDLVICCRPGNGSAALTTMRQLMTRLWLTVNEAKTGLVRLPEESFDFLGFSVLQRQRKGVHHELTTLS